MIYLYCQIEDELQISHITAGDMPAFPERMEFLKFACWILLQRKRISDAWHLNETGNNIL